MGHFLGGNEWQPEAGPNRQLVPRPVTVVDAGYEKELDLQVERDYPGMTREKRFRGSR